jgi:hypothetical protein
MALEHSDLGRLERVWERPPMLGHYLAGMLQPVPDPTRNDTSTRLELP